MKNKPEKYTREWFVEKGRKGGTRTKKLHGIKHFQQMSVIKKNKLAQEQEEK